MTKKNPSKIAKTIKIENQEKLKKILLKKNDVTWYEILINTFQQQNMLSKKYLNLKRKKKNNKSMQKEWIRLMTNWNIKKLDLKKKIAVEKLKTQRIKAENFDLTRKISDLRQQIRESMTISSISIVSTSPTASAASVIAKSIVIVTTNYQPRGNNSKEFLNDKNSDAYSSWAFTIKKNQHWCFSVFEWTRKNEIRFFSNDQFHLRCFVYLDYRCRFFSFSESLL